MPVIPATWEAEAGECLDSGAEIILLHSILGNKSEIPSQKNTYIYNVARVEGGNGLKGF